MARKEWLIAFAEALQRLEFAAYVQGAVGVVADVERNDSDRVTGDEEFVLLLVVQGKCEDTAEVLEEVDSLLLIEGKNDFAVAAGLEGILVRIPGADCGMVVDLAVDGKNMLSVRRHQRLSAGKRIYDRQSLMGENRCLSTIDSAPVRSSVTDLL